MIKLGFVACVFLASVAAGCKKDAAAGAPPPQKDLQAEVAGKALAPLHGLAQPDPARGKSYRLTFSTRPLTCASNVAPIAGDLKVDATPRAGAVELAFAGAMDYAPGDAPYAVALAGAVSATVCEVP